MSGDPWEESPDAVVFAGPNGRLALTFDPATLEDGASFECFPRATATFEGIGLHAAGRFAFFQADLAPFALAFAQAHATLRGVAAIESEDGDFGLKVDYGNGGGVTVSGHIQPSLEKGSKLLFELATDQNYLTGTPLALRALLR